MHRIDQWSWLALLRFLLAVVVAVNHLGGMVTLGVLAPIPYFGAFEAILGFLLISGYSVESSYLKLPEGFLRRRLWRLYPIYLSAILITFAILPQHWTPQLALTLVVNALFLNQALTSTSFVGPAWSLSLEFWLYSLVPWFNRWPDAHLRQVAYCSFAMYCLYTAARTLFHLPYYAGVGYGLNLVFLSFAWICGLRLAKFERLRNTILVDVAVMFGGHLLLQALIQLAFRWKRHMLGAFVSEDLLHLLAQGATLVGILISFRLLVLRQNRGSFSKSLTMRILGDISYPLYLIHIPMFVLLNQIGLGGSAFVMIAAAIAAAWVLYHAVDVYSRRRERASVLAT